MSSRQVETVTSFSTRSSEPISEVDVTQQQQQQQQQPQEPQQPQYIMVDPEEIYADLEQLRLSRCQTSSSSSSRVISRQSSSSSSSSGSSSSSSSSGTIESKEPITDENSNANDNRNNNKATTNTTTSKLLNCPHAPPQVSMCGVPPEMTSSILQRLYAAGASSMAKEPPKKVGRGRSLSNDLDENQNSEPTKNHHHHHHHQDHSSSSWSPPDMKGILCGTSSSSFMNRILAVGAETVAQTRDQMCHREPEGVPPRNHYYSEEDDDDVVILDDPVPFQNAKALRVLELAEDLNTVSPHFLHRKNLIDMVQQSQERTLQARMNSRNNNNNNNNNTTTITCATGAFPVESEQRKKARALVAAKFAQKRKDNYNMYVDKDDDGADDDDDDTDGYPSDMDEFLECARIIVEEQNASPFDPASYREFESVLQQVVQVFGMDDADEDDDSLVSADSFSGYDGDAATIHKQRLLEENSLISDSSYRRVKGSIAHKKKSSKISRGIAKSIDGGKKLSEFSSTMESNEVSDPVAPLIILSDGEGEVDSPIRNRSHAGGDHEDSSQEEDEDEDDESTTLDSSSFTQAVREQKTKLQPVQRRADHMPKDDSSSVLDMSGMMTEPSIETNNNAKLDKAAKRLFEFASTSRNNLSSRNPNRTLPRDANNISTDSDYTITTGNSVTAIQKQLQQRNRKVIDKYDIDPEDNSLVSDTSFQSTQRIRKRRYRSRKERGIRSPTKNRKDPVPLLPSDEKTTEPRAVVGFDRTVDDLAFLLTEGSYHDKNRGHASSMPQQQDVSGVDRGAILQKLQNVSPELHRAVVARIDSEYKKPVDRRKDDASREAKRASSRLPLRLISSNTVDHAYSEDKSPDYDSVHRPPHGRERERARNDPSEKLQARNDKSRNISCLSNMRINHPILSQVDESNPLADESQGSFWSDVLDVVEEDQSSDEVPSISVDDASCSFINDLYRIGSVRQADGSYLDEMVDNFLTEKVDHLNLLVQERNNIMAQRVRVFEELKNTPYTLNHRGTDRVNDEGGTAHVQRGRALIRKIQRKRQAMQLARQREEQLHLGSRMLFADHARTGTSPRPSSQSSGSQGRSEQNYPPNESLDNVSNKGNESREEVRLEDFLIGSMAQPTSSSSPASASKSEMARDAIRRVRERRMKLRLGRSAVAISQTKKAPHESLDSTLESEETAHTGSAKRGYSGIISPPSVAIIPSFRKNTKKTESTSRYEALPEQNSSFCSSELESGDHILRTLAPPSPESPIRDYNGAVEVQLSSPASNIAELCAVASGDLSGDEGRMLLFTSSDTEKSDSSFDDILFRSAKKNQTPMNEDNIFINIRKKDSPTSIADFFNFTDNFDQGKPAHSKGYQNGWELGTGVPDETDEFLHTAMDLSMLQNQDDEFLGPDLHFPTRFTM